MGSQFLLFDILDCQKIKENATIFSTIGILIVYDADFAIIIGKKSLFPCVSYGI